MNKYRQKIMLSGFLLSATFAFGQFNTLKPVVSQTEPETFVKTEVPETIKKEQKSRNLFKKIWGATNKTDLKREVDTLKTLIKEYEAFHRQQWDLQHTKDSLMLNAQTKKLENRNTKNYFQKEKKAPFGGVEAFMPLNNKMEVTSGLDKTSSRVGNSQTTQRD